MLRPTDSAFQEGIDGHRRRVDLFREGTITPDEFRPMRLSYGLYYQLDHTSHMQRIKIPGGLLTTAQMNCLTDVTDRYGRGVDARHDAPGRADPLGAGRRRRGHVRSAAGGRHHDARRVRRQRPQRHRVPA